MSKILVVDDSSTVRDEVAGFLKKNGLAVDTAVDGKDGLAKIKANPGLKLVISDVNMPNMDGLTMVEKVRGELGNKGAALITAGSLTLALGVGIVLSRLLGIA